jgi:hypothetical protein
MTNYEIKERVAAGLRRLKIPPDYLLLCDGALEEGCEEFPSVICGIPVIYSAFISAFGNCCLPMLFCPVWATSGCYNVERRCFEDGYWAGG